MSNFLLRYKTIKQSAGNTKALIGILLYTVDKILKHKTTLYFWYIERCVQQQLNCKTLKKNETVGTQNFSGKMPIWVCWFQGKDDMPELVAMCYKQLRKMADDTCVVNLITSENVSDYITVDPRIKTKVENKSYTLTQFSDLLRVKLLSLYGGLWIDSTVYVSKTINKSLINNGFFSQKYITGNPYSNMYVSGNKWSVWLLGDKANKPLFNYCDQMLSNYYINVESPIDYYLIDYIIMSAYINDDNIRLGIDAVPENNQKTYKLESILNEKYNVEKLRSVLNESQFHKLSYKDKLKKKDADGDFTNYGELQRR